MDIKNNQLNIKNNYFFIVLIIFVFSIFLLVFSNSWVLLIVGWDGLGLTSFLLVIFYNNRGTLDSGLVTVLSNRVGDCLFILRFLPMFYSGWFYLDFLTIPYGNSFLFSFLLVLGSITKRAQFPFSSWLPAAIAAPTPVSSLVHSSTLVTAGVYVTLRFNFLVNRSFIFFSTLSLITIVMAGICAIVEIDFKKVVAISTLRQIGLILFSITMGYWIVSFFHIVFHAFFKSCVFLATGNLMHSLRRDQDSRNFGSIGYSAFSSIYFSLSVVSLAGFPFSLGFYSKDLIIRLFSSGENKCVVILFLVGCCFTVAYRYKLVIIRFMGNPSQNSNVSFMDEVMFFSPLIVTYVFCVFIGNFFFFDYLSPVIFSFFDLSLGVYIIFGGLVIIILFSKGYFTRVFMSTILFVNRFTLILPSAVKHFHPKIDYSWGEVFSGDLLIKITYIGSIFIGNLVKVNIWGSMRIIGMLLLIIFIN